MLAGIQWHTCRYVRGGLFQPHRCQKSHLLKPLSEQHLNSGWCLCWSCCVWLSLPSMKDPKQSCSNGAHSLYGLKPQRSRLRRCCSCLPPLSNGALLYSRSRRWSKSKSMCLKDQEAAACRWAQVMHHRNQNQWSPGTLLWQSHLLLLMHYLTARLQGPHHQPLSALFHSARIQSCSSLPS